MSNRWWITIKRIALAVPTFFVGVVAIRFFLMFLVAVMIGG